MHCKALVVNAKMHPRKLRRCRCRTAAAAGCSWHSRCDCRSFSIAHELRVLVCCQCGWACMLAVNWPGTLLQGGSLDAPRHMCRKGPSVPA